MSPTTVTLAKRFTVFALFAVLVLLSVLFSTPSRDPHSFPVHRLPRRDVFLAERRLPLSSIFEQITRAFASSSSASESASITGTSSSGVFNTSSSTDSGIQTAPVTFTSTVSSSPFPTSIDEPSTTQSNSSTTTETTTSSVSPKSRPSSPSSRLTSSRSSTVTTPILVTAGSTTDQIPATTLELLPPESSTDSTSPSNSAKPITNEASTNSGFLTNKSAVAVTFTVVGLVTLVGAFGIFVLMKKRKLRHQVPDDATFGMFRRESTFSPYPDAISLGASTSEMHQVPPLDLPTNVYYNANYYDHSSQHGHSSSGHSHARHQDGYDYTISPVTPPSDPFADAYSPPPAQKTRTLKSPEDNFLAPAAQHDPARRDSYQPSIDSFYGASGRVF